MTKIEKILILVAAGMFLACSESEFASSSGGKDKSKKDKVDDSDLETDDGHDDDQDSDDNGEDDPLEINDETQGGSDGKNKDEFKDSDLIDDELSYVTPGNADDIDVSDSLLKVCTKQDIFNLSIVNDSNLPANAGYSNVDGQSTFTLPDTIVRAKGYFVTLGQDDAGAWLEVNGTRVLQMKNAHYAAGNWTFDGKDKAQSVTPPNTATTNWLNSIGGVQNATDILIQGFPLKAGGNTIKGNVRDVFGAYRSLSATIQIRSLVRIKDACP